MKKIINYLLDTVKKEKSLLVFTTIMFIVGIVAGSLFINIITASDKKLLIEQIEVFFSSIKRLSNDVFGINAFLGEITNNFIQLFIIFVLGISMIGIPAVIIIMFFKGFMLGTTLGVFILKYQLKGILGCFLYIFPAMIINVLIYIFFSFFAVHVSIKFLKALVKKDNLSFKTFLGKYILVFLISIILITLVCLLDAFLTPLLLKLLTFLL